MKQFYFISNGDSSDGQPGLQVIFGTQEEIDNDSLEGEGVSAQDFEYFQEVLEDNTSLCEDYLIDSEKFRCVDEIEKVKSIIENKGYIFNEDLENCAWG